MEQRAGYLLWLQGVITTEEIQDAMTDSDVRTEVQELLESSGFTDQETLYRFLSRHESLAPIDLEAVKPSDAALAMLRPSASSNTRNLILSSCIERRFRRSKILPGVPMRICAPARIASYPSRRWAGC